MILAYNHFSLLFVNKYNKPNNNNNSILYTIYGNTHVFHQFLFLFSVLLCLNKFTIVTNVSEITTQVAERLSHFIVSGCNKLE